MNIHIGIIIQEEKLSNGKPIFVAHCNSLNVTSQGKTIEEAKKNIGEAISIELEECPEKREQLLTMPTPLVTLIEVDNNVKASHTIGQRAN